MEKGQTLSPSPASLSPLSSRSSFHAHRRGTDKEDEIDRERERDIKVA